MAAVIGDIVADHSRFHGMVAGAGLQHEHTQVHDPSYHHASEPRSRPRQTSSASSQGHPYPIQDEKPAAQSTGGASRFPTPPSSSSPNTASVSAACESTSSPSTRFMATQTQTAASAVPAGSSASARQPPSPDSDTYASSSDPRTAFTENASTSQPGKTIKIRDLAHIQSLAQADLMNGDPPLQAMKYEISGMPIGDIIEMVAALLSKITTTNDLQHDAQVRNATHQQTAASHNNDGTSMSPLSSSVLAFHGKNIPAITILNYLSRIHKYCPTTFEVFLSLVVYFDRMGDRVNEMVKQAEKTRRQQDETGHGTERSAAEPKASAHGTDVEMRDGDGSEASDESDSDLADDDDEKEPETSRTAAAEAGSSAARSGSSPATYFVVDSFNIHRLIIAGVTCASKFFSDVFYTNSRYAKVGGLPLPELNHLELQFLVLNDFRLSVPVEDLEAYATMLVEFYGREFVAQRSQPASGAE